MQRIINSFEKKTRSTNNNDNNNSTNKKKIITFPWVPKAGPKIKKETQKFGFRVAFQTAPHVKNILCKKQDKSVPNSYPGG